MDIYGQIMDRIQRLTAALYRITDILSDKEPLKWTLRNKAISIYDNLMSIRFIKDKDNVLNNMINSLSLIIGSLELVSMGTYISNLNFEILKKEYINLKAFIEGEKQNIAPEITLLPQPVQKPKGHSNGHIKAGPHSHERERKGKIMEFLKNQAPKTIKEIAFIFEGISIKSIQRDLLELVKSGQLKASGERRWRTYFLD